MVRFRFLDGDINYLQYGGRWISNKFNNGEFNYWFVLKLDNLEDLEGRKVKYKYLVTLTVVAPSQVSQEEQFAAIKYLGLEALPESEVEQVAYLSHAGIGAFIWGKKGNNYRALFKQARYEAEQCSMLFGFYMDRRQNAIGSTGWDFLRGDKLAGLTRSQTD